MLPCKLTAFSLVLFWVFSVVVLHSAPPVHHQNVAENRKAKEEELEEMNRVVIELNDQNVKYVSDNYSFVLVLFYVKWCRFSVEILPTFDKLIFHLRAILPKPHKFAITKIDCDVYENVCDNYGILKFPTIKVMRHGSIEKLEYRKDRTLEAMIKYVREELVDPTLVASSEEEALMKQSDQRRIIGFLSKKRPGEEEIFRKAASHFKNLCLFILHLNDSDDPPRVIFKPDAKSPEDEEAQMPHNGSMTFEYLRDWSNYKCVPFVREITFENAEELTEEGLPLLILFYHPQNHTDLVKAFKRLVTKHFADDIIKRKMNFVTADGKLFDHPLSHLGKTVADLPLIAIDSLKHMFTYPYHSREDLLNLEKLHRYLDDFYSERLHLKFHNLLLFEDEEEEEVEPEEVKDDNPNGSYPQPTILKDQQFLEQQIPSEPQVESTDELEENGTKILKESDFIKLYPSEKRYTLKKRIRDEL